jgi:hypothetical protein
MPCVATVYLVQRISSENEAVGSVSALRTRQQFCTEYYGLSVPSQNNRSFVRRYTESVAQDLRP